jgi:antitoxin CcdA
MKHFIKIEVDDLLALECDKCGLRVQSDSYEFQEFFSIVKQCGYGSVFGDGEKVSADFCQKCFKGLIGSYLVTHRPSK